MRKRTLARECALTIFYQKDITRFDIQVVVDNFWKNEEKADPEVKNLTALLDRNPDATGNYERAAFGAGQVGALIRDIKPIREIIAEMVS